ncbi:MAG: response regulator transcription factor [Desulfobacteraceae bacterium]|nr:response regulator transcription factor [Desulfobacteraceae bacterium]MBU4055005.1 response regulator [Pseudomonadota bacterium]
MWTNTDFRDGPALADAEAGPDLMHNEKPTDRVLVIYDDQHLHQFLPMYFSKVGIRAVYSDNVQDGYGKFLAAPVEMVFADMGVLGTWTLACHIKKQYPNIPVVLMMDQRGEYYIERVKENGIDSVLIKPFGLNALKNKIREIYDIGD